MSRTIKFRAWDKLTKTLRVGNMLEVAICFDNPDFAVMQWTGLMDRHGTEIYEGDIVNSHAQDFTAEPSYRTVIADPDCPGSLCFEPGIGEILCVQNQDTFEVIGNVYEHPNLMGGHGVDVQEV